MKTSTDLVPIESDQSSVMKGHPFLGEWRNKPEQCRQKGQEDYATIKELRDALKKARKRQRREAFCAFAKAKGQKYSTLKRKKKIADQALAEARAKGKDERMAQIIALTPDYGSNRGHYPAWSLEAIDHAKGLYLSQQRLNVSLVHQLTVNEAAIHGWKTGSEDSLRYLLKKETCPADRTLAREGVRRYVAECEAKMLINYKEIPVNFFLLSDNCVMDLFLLVAGKHIRPYLTVWHEMRSRSIMGWCISFQPNAQTIAHALAHAITKKDDARFPQHGLPAAVLIDNGKDFRSEHMCGKKVLIDGKNDYLETIKRFAGLGIDPFYIDLSYDPDQAAYIKKRGQRNLIIRKIKVGGVFARLGIEQHFATVYHPWAKGAIERFFRKVAEDFCRLLPGWCGSNPKQRPEKLANEMKDEKLLTLSQFCELFYEWIIRYNHTPQSGHGMDGRTPTEVFLSGGPVEEVDPELLTFAFLRKDRVKMNHWGFFLDGHRFELALSDDPPGPAIFHQLVNSYVSIYYTPNYQILRVYQAGRYICDGRPLRRASRMNPDDPVFEEKRCLQARQRKHAQAMLAAIKQKALPDPERQFRALPAPQEEEQAIPALPLDPGMPTANPPKTQRSLDLIPQSDMHRYDLILDMRVNGMEPCEEDRVFEKEYEQTEEYKKAQRIWEQELKQRTYSLTRGPQ